MHEVTEEEKELYEAIKKIPDKYLSPLGIYCKNFNMIIKESCGSYYK
jgi:hypothetical protein